MRYHPFTRILPGLIALISVALQGDEAGKTLPWAFQPLQKHDTPKVKKTTWPKSRIDYFILAAMEKERLSPAPEADARTLQRRLSFDLVGLPPNSAGGERMAQNSSPEDWSALINHYLASPHYGERWGRHWLDLARYTDISESWSESKSPPWLYRDCVVSAFNADLPYDQFVIKQLANDLLPDSRPEDNAALGFIGLSPSYWKELQLPPDIIGVTVAEEWEERMDTLGRTFLGLTLACARCHDHKTDPVSAQDYYALAGVFASVKISDQPVVAVDLWKPVAAAREKVAGLERKRDDLKKAKPASADLKDQVAAIEKEITNLKATPHYHLASANGVVEAALFVKKKDDGKHGTMLDYVEGMSRDLPVHLRGNPNDTGDVISRRFLTAFPRSDGKPRPLTSGSGRLDLAKALVEEASPLSARVIVNRVWHHHFGRGLVETPSEFGPAGERPTHPELLNDLASRFVENGWSIKWLHREILGSATWRQSSQVSPEAEAGDPANRYYSHMTRRRLDIEAWRDAMLSATGELDLTVGGEPFSLDDSTRVRRTLYGTVKRRELSAMLSVNDFPDPIAHSPTRTETATPLQQLYVMNGPFVIERSASLARLAAKHTTENPGLINFLYKRLFLRPPTEREQEIALAYLGDGGSLDDLAQVILSGNESLYLD